MVAHTVVNMEQWSISEARAGDERGASALTLDPCPWAADALLDRYASGAMAEPDLPWEADVLPGNEQLKWALTAPPCAAVADVLAFVDPMQLPGDVRVDLIKAWERVAAWVSAGQQAALAAVVEATEDACLPGHLARHEVGAALRLSPGTAYDRCQRARQLTGRLDATLALLATGAISVGQAWAIADAVENLDDEVAAEVQARVLRRATAQTNAQTRQAIRRAVLVADPLGSAERAAQAHAERRLTKNALDDGMTELRAIVDATDAERVWQELSRRATQVSTGLRTEGAEHPGIDALRVDALVDGILSTSQAAGDAAGRVPPAKARQDPPVQVYVTVDLATLLRMADNPGELAGYGPIPAHLARQLAADGEWTRWTTDPQTAHLLDVGARRYRPSAGLARFVRAAHPFCGWVGCRQSATRCDLDHVVEFERGGLTTRSNLAPLCRQHHNAKTHGGWKYSRDDDDTGHLVSPLGRTYDIPPSGHPPDG